MKFRIISLLVIVLLLVSCNNKKYDKYQNEDDVIRIVSLAPSITRELIDLGLKDNIVGATSYCEVSESNNDLVIGSAITVNIEKVLLLKPDIVFASGLTKEKTIHTLKENGVTVYKFGKMTSFNYICENFIELAKYVDKEDVAKSIINSSKAKMDSLIASVPKQKDSLSIFFQVGSKPIFTVIPNTFMNDYITYAGCKNIVSDLTNPSINRETVINRNPDIIFIISMGIEGTNEKNIWKKYPELNAAKNNKIFIVDADKVALPTVRSFTESFEIIINDIYN